MEAARLRDGTEVLLRAIEPQDKRLVLDAFERLSPTSRFRRFHSPMPELPDVLLRYLTEVDHHDHEALVAVDAHGGQALAVARFVRDRERPEQAEAAIAVVDDCQRRGLGTLMLERLAARAREEGIERFTALVQAENRKALSLFERLGARVAGREGAEVQLELDIPPREGIGVQLRAVLRAAAEQALAVRQRRRSAG